MRPLSWLPYGWEPLDYLVYAVVSGAVYALVGWRWWLVPVLLAGLFLWPYLVRFLRWAWRRGWVRSRGAVRKPGESYCPECGSALAAGQDQGRLSHQPCPDGCGRWCASSGLAESWSRRNKPVPEWKAFEKGIEKEELPCPKCSQAMVCGSFVGAGFTTFRCEACGGIWFSRIDWVSFELWVS